MVSCQFCNDKMWLVHVVDEQFAALRAGSKDVADSLRVGYCAYSTVGQMAFKVQPPG